MADQLRNRLAEISCGQRVGIKVVIGIGLTRNVMDGAAQPVKSRKAFRFRHSAPLRSAVGKCASLDEEPYFEYAVMADETNCVAHFVETAGRVGKVQRHGWFATSTGIEEERGSALRSCPCRMCVHVRVLSSSVLGGVERARVEPVAFVIADRHGVGPLRHVERSP